MESIGVEVKIDNQTSKNNTAYHKKNQKYTFNFLRL